MLDSALCRQRLFPDPLPAVREMEALNGSKTEEVDIARRIMGQGKWDLFSLL